MKLFLLIAVAFAVWLLWTKRSRAADAAAPASAPVEAPGLGPVAASGADTAANYGGNALDNIMQAISQFEGGKPGNINVVNNNPGNLKEGPNMTGTANGYATFGDQGDGWDALSSWITKHTSANPDWDFYDMFGYYLRGSTNAPTVDAQGNSDAYAEYVSKYLGVDPTHPVSSLLGDN